MMIIYINRRVFVGLLAAILFGAPSRAFAQRLAKLPRIGVLIGVLRGKEWKGKAKRIN